MLLRTEAIVLHSAHQGETSRRVILYTRDQGRLSAIAKGARLVRSKFGSSLQPLSHVQAVMYCRTPHSLHILRECAYIESFQHTSQDLNKLAVGLRICELTHYLTESEDPDPGIFDLLLRVLQALNDTRDTEKQLLLLFQLKLAGLLGFAPVFSKRAVQELTDSGGYLQHDDGAVTTDRPAAGSSAWASRSVLRAFAVFARADIDTALNWPITPLELRELRRLIEDFLKFHVADAYPVKGGRILQTLFDTAEAGRSTAPSGRHPETNPGE